MKRKGKPKKPTHVTAVRQCTKQTKGAEVKSNAEARSLNVIECLSTLADSHIHSVSESDALNRPDARLIYSSTSRETIRVPESSKSERRSRVRHAQRSSDAVQVNDRMSELKVDLPVAPTGENVNLNDDYSVPDYTAMPDLSVPSTPDTASDARHSMEKSDPGISHNQRRINKRELKAFLKQTKKSRCALDEQVVATINGLAGQFKECAIDLNPPALKPMLIAPSPTAQLQSTGFTGRGFGGRAGGRRGSRRGRRATKHADLSRTNALPTIPASWVPLMLPYCQPMKHTAHASDPCFPWLSQLSETRVNRFVSSMQQIPPVQHTHDRHSTSKLTSELPNDAKRFTYCPSHHGDLSAPSHSLMHSSSVPRTHEESPSPAKFLHCTVETDLQHTLGTQRSIEDSQLVNVSESCQISRPPFRSLRGRHKGRRSHRGKSMRLTNVYLGAAPAVLHESHRTGALPPSMRTTTKAKSKPRISRELRGLVTWDALIAQQKLQQAEAQLEASDENSELRTQRQVDATLAVAENLLAQATNDETVSRTRRTRQSSGSGTGQMLSSAHHSETTCTVTTASVSLYHKAPDVADSETPFHSKSVTRSGVNTGSSSITSELPVTTTFSTKSESNGKKGLHTSPRSDASYSDVGKFEEKDKALGLTPVSGTVSPANEPISCAAKYSPISVDHESEPQVGSQDVLEAPEEVVLIKPAQVHRRGVGRRRGKGRVQRILESSLAKSCLSNAAELSSSIQSSYVTPSSSDLAIPTTSPGVSTSLAFHRRRHLHASPVSPSIHADSDSGASIEQHPRLIDSYVSANTCIPAIPSPTGHLRRSSTARSSALPPRKRYKVGLDSSATDSDSTKAHPPIVTSQSNTEDNITSFTPTSPSLFSNSQMSNSSIPLVSSKPPGALIAHRQVKRGRPSRRVTATDTIHVSMSTCFTTTSSNEASTVLLDRPKREAAAIGFASLVAANLNNNIAAHSAMDSPTLRPHESDSHIPPTESNADILVISNPPLTPRGRGRPPKPKVVPQPTIAVIGDTKSVSDSESSLKDGLLSTSRRKRPAMVLSPGGKTYKPVSAASSVNELPSQPVRSCVSISNTSIESSPNPVVSCGRPKISRLTKVVSPDYTSDAALTTSPKRARKVGIRCRDQPVDTMVIETTKESTIPEVLSSTTPNLRLLPARDSLFQGHLLTDSVLLDVDLALSRKGPVCDIFLRFVNEPDPNELDSRLCAPFIFLPSPEKYPEFYRFVISSYSGTIVRARFTDSLLRRLFSNASIEVTKDDAIYGVEFPCLCLASIAKWLMAEPSLREKLGHELGLSASEQVLLSLDPSDVENSIPLLDAAVEGVLSVWEAFAGRRSWLGRRLTRLRALYSTIRNECARTIADEYNKFVPPLKATAVLNMPNCRIPIAGTKKKTDRRALERGAEVIRCLCGFRVEGGHAMVQCDRCAAWQHLPCLWWALNQTLKQPSDNIELSQLCQAALIAAQAAGLSDISETMDSGTTGKGNIGESPYFCPICLGLTGLTLEYPRSLSAAMATNDLESVFSLQETTVEGEHEFWSLASVDGLHQIRTDDYAFVSRAWLDCALAVSKVRIELKPHMTADDVVTNILNKPITTFYDRVVIRIYRLWKDTSGRPWMEGGLFLRPYDLPTHSITDSSDSVDASRLWHHREVIYDETSRLVLPLSAWNGRCIVLCPSAYRSGRPADLLSYKEVSQFLCGSDCNMRSGLNDTDSPSTTTVQLFFVCDKLFERMSQTTDTCGYRFDEISPGYLKVNMRPYGFLRKPDVSVGRASLARTLTALELLEQDRSPIVSTEHVQEQGPPSTSLTNTKPKGEKLARVVDWLERKRQMISEATCATVSSKSVDDGISANLTGSPICVSSSLSARSPRGRPRGNRGRGRTSRLNAVVAPPSNELATGVHSSGSSNLIDSMSTSNSQSLETADLDMVTNVHSNFKMNDIQTSEKWAYSHQQNEPFVSAESAFATHTAIKQYLKPLLPMKLDTVDTHLGSTKNTIGALEPVCSTTDESAICDVIGVPPVPQRLVKFRNREIGRKKKHSITRKRVASTSTLFTIPSEETGFLSDSELLHTCDFEKPPEGGSRLKFYSSTMDSTCLDGSIPLSLDTVSERIITETSVSMDFISSGSTAPVATGTVCAFPQATTIIHSPIPHVNPSPTPLEDVVPLEDEDDFPITLEPRIVDPITVYSRNEGLVMNDVLKIVITDSLNKFSKSSYQTITADIDDVTSDLCNQNSVTPKNNTSLVPQPSLDDTSQFTCLAEIDSDSKPAGQDLNIEHGDSKDSAMLHPDGSRSVDCFDVIDRVSSVVSCETKVTHKISDPWYETLRPSDSDATRSSPSNASAELTSDLPNNPENTTHSVTSEISTYSVERTEVARAFFVEHLTTELSRNITTSAENPLHLASSESGEKDHSVGLEQPISNSVTDFLDHSASVTTTESFGTAGHVLQSTSESIENEPTVDPCATPILDEPGCSGELLRPSTVLSEKVIQCLSSSLDALPVLPFTNPSSISEQPYRHPAEPPPTRIEKLSPLKPDVDRPVSSRDRPDYRYMYSHPDFHYHRRDSRHSSSVSDRYGSHYRSHHDRDDRYRSSHSPSRHDSGHFRHRHHSHKRSPSRDSVRHRDSPSTSQYHHHSRKDYSSIRHRSTEERHPFSSAKGHHSTRPGSSYSSSPNRTNSSSSHRQPPC